MRRGRGLGVLRALAAFGASVALLCGVPALLIALVGNPLPSSVPSIDEIGITLTQNGDGFARFIIGLLAVLVWSIWLQICIAFVVEIVAVIRRTESRPIVLVPGLQSAVAKLVAAMTLASVLALSPVAPALDLGALPPITLPDTSALPPEEPRDAETPPLGVVQSADDVGRFANEGIGSSRRSSRSSSGSVASVTSVEVAEAIELWDLAELVYGDGVRWRDIAQLNVGRLDASGQTITHDTEGVPAGSQLDLPGDVDLSRVAGLASTAVDGRSAKHVVQPGESMWTIADDALAAHVGTSTDRGDLSAYWSAVVEQNHDVPSGDVDLIHPGDELSLPPIESILPHVAATANPDPNARVEVDVWTSGADGESPARGAPVAPALPDTAPPAEVDAGLADHVIESWVAQPGGSFDQVLDVRSELDLSEVGPARPEVTTDPVEVEADPVEVEALPPSSEVDAQAANGESMPVAPIGLAAFGSALLAAGLRGALRRRRELQARLRSPSAVRPIPSTPAAAFEAALAHASERVVASASGGWAIAPASVIDDLGVAAAELHASADGRLEVVPLCDVEVDEPRVLDLTDRREAREPMSLLIGTDDNGNAVFVEIAPGEAMRVEGGAGDVRRFARGLLLDVAVAERVPAAQVIAIGFGEEVADLDRLHVVAEAADALAHVRSQGLSVATSARANDDPHLVVAATAAFADRQVVADLRAAGAVVVGPGLDTPLVASIEGDQVVISPSGTSATLAAPTEAEFGHVVELVDATALEQVTGEQLTAPRSSRKCDLLEAGPEPGPIEVLVLGPVEIDGATTFSSVKAVDVVAYLAFHRSGATADQLKTWVWPAFEPPTDKAFANVMSRARSALGTDDDGELMLSRARADKTYQLSSSVTTDFERFSALVRLADDAASAADELAHLKAALDLIRGVPFSGGTASSFAWADNHVRALVEYTIDEAVHRCADLAMAEGDLSLARWSALKGLELVPGCEQCYRRRFLIAGAGNNPSELRRAMAELERAAAAELGEPEALDLISVELLGLYADVERELLSGAK